MQPIRITTLFPGLLLSTMHPALAHPGDHTRIDLVGLAAHLFEADHLIFAGLAAVAAAVAWRAGRRAVARAPAKTQKRGRTP